MSDDETPRRKLTVRAVASCECGAKLFVKPGSAVHRGDEKIIACPECGGNSVVLADADHDLSAEDLARLRRKERQSGDR